MKMTAASSNHPHQKTRATLRKLNRFFIYFFAFTVPPVMVAILSMLSVAMDTMVIRNEIEPLAPTAAQTGDQPVVSDATPSTISAPVGDPEEIETSHPEEPRLTAVFLLGNQGTQITDFLGPYEVLASSRAFRVVTAAPRKALSPTTGSLAVLPDLTLEETAGTIPTIDLLVVPALVNAREPGVAEWLKSVAPKARMILSVGEGARVLALAGVLDGRSYTTHALAMDDLEKTAPQAKLVRDVRYTSDDRLISSAGITAGLDAAFLAIEKLHGRHLAEQTARRLQYARRPPENRLFEGFDVADALRMFLHGGFDWKRRSVGVFLYDGVSELGLAAGLDTFPRTLSARAVTLAEKRVLIRTRNGLQVVPNVDMYHAPRLDTLVVPSHHGANWRPHETAPLARESVTRWLGEYQAEDLHKEDLTSSPAGVSFDRTLDLLARTEGSGITRLVARVTEYPWRPIHSRNDWPPLGLLVRPLLIGLFGLFLVSRLEQRYWSGRTAAPAR